MDRVKPPEDRKDVVDAVPDPERVVEEDDDEPNRDGPWQPDHVEEPDVAPRHPLRDGDEQRRLQQRDGAERDAARRQVASDAPKFRFPLFPKGSPRFVEKEKEKDGNRRGHRAPEHIPRLSVHFLLQRLSTEEPAKKPELSRKPSISII